MSVLLLLGAAQGAFLSLVLARAKRRNRIPNLFLACLLLNFSIGLVEGFMSVTYLYVRFPYLIGVQWPLTFLCGPLAYFYVKSLTDPEWRVKQRQLAAHFLPAVIMYIYLIPLFLLNPEAKGKLWLLQNSSLKNSALFIDPVLIVVIMQMAGYLILSLRLLKVHSINIREKFSSIENVNLSWLRTLAIIFICLLCMYAFFELFSQFYGVYKEAEYMLNIMIAIFIYVMGYKGIRQADIFTAPVLLPAVEEIQGPDNTAALGEKLIQQQATAGTEEPAKYTKSSLSDGQADTILSKLTQLMEKEKPYLEMGLPLPALSSMLAVSPNHLSQVINGKLNKSFFDFVNMYRVEEAKIALISPESDRFSILGIAMEVGFNSKNAFYSAFKKYTGMTPSQFREHRRDAQESVLPERI